MPTAGHRQIFCVDNAAPLDCSSSSSSTGTGGGEARVFDALRKQILFEQNRLPLFHERIPLKFLRFLDEVTRSKKDRLRLDDAVTIDARRVAQIGGGAGRRARELSSIDEGNAAAAAAVEEEVERAVDGASRGAAKEEKEGANAALHNDEDEAEVIVVDDDDDDDDDDTDADAEFEVMLKIFNNVGLLMWKDEPDMRDVIILRPQWLLDHIRRILCVRSLDDIIDEEGKHQEGGGAAATAAASAETRMQDEFRQLRQRMNEAGADARQDLKDLRRFGRLNVETLLPIFWDDLPEVSRSVSQSSQPSQESTTALHASTADVVLSLPRLTKRRPKCFSFRMST